MSARPGTRGALAAALALVCAAAVLALPAQSASAAPGRAITSTATGRCLEVAGADRAPGAALGTAACTGRAHQRWSLSSSADLKVFDGGRCLEAEGGASAPGTLAVTATCAGSANQKWRTTASGALVHQRSGRCLETRTDGRVDLRACTGGAGQRWTVAAQAPDVTAPTPPSGLGASALTCEAVTLSWSASTDAAGVTAYDVYHDGQLVTTTRGVTRTARVEVVGGVEWGWYVNARDAAGNVSQASATVPVTPPRCGSDTAPPTAPTGITTAVDGTSVTVGWRASTDDTGVTGYEVRRDGVAVGTVAGSVLSFTDSGLAPRRAYSYAVVARDAQGNRSQPSTAASATTGAACGTAICGVAEVARDSDLPWGLATLPDGSVLYSRRDAAEIVRLDPATGATAVAARVPGVQGTDGEGGLMGLAVASDFASDPWVYAMLTTAVDNRVVRMRYANGVVDTGSTQVLLTGILRNKYHNGGRLRFGPDGMLYVATGDAQNEDYAQRLTGTGALNGKILRISRTGGIPADNPFGSAIWSYGHRNPQGLAFDSRGRLWQQEFGNSVMDETNLVVRGGNHGWPQCEGTFSRSGSGCAGAGLVAPKRTYPTSEGSCSGLTVIRDAVYIGCGRGQRLYRATISGDSLTGVEQFFVGTYGRLRTVEPTADGDLWLTTTNRGDKDSIANNSDERLLRVSLGR